MTNQPQPQTSAASLPQPPPPAKTAGVAAEQALVPSPHPISGEGEIPRNSAIARLPVELDVAVPVRQFRVHNLLALEPGDLIETQWAHGEDMPLSAGAVQLAWTEFEVIESELAVRVTRLI